MLLNEMNIDTELNDSNANTCLHVAARTGRVEIVRFLLSKDANVHSRGRIDYTPLHFAAENGYVEIVRLLLQAGAKVYHHTTTGKLASDFATNRMVKYILEEEETKLISKVNLREDDGEVAEMKVYYGKIRGIHAHDH